MSKVIEVHLGPGLHHQQNETDMSTSQTLASAFNSAQDSPFLVSFHVCFGNCGYCTLQQSEKLNLAQFFGFFIE